MFQFLVFFFFVTVFFWFGLVFVCFDFVCLEEGVVIEFQLDRQFEAVPL